VRISTSWDRPGRRAKGSVQTAANVRTADGKNGQNVRRHSLHSLYASMVKQKKRTHSQTLYARNVSVAEDGNIDAPDICLFSTLVPGRCVPPSSRQQYSPFCLTSYTGCQARGGWELHWSPQISTVVRIFRCSAVGGEVRILGRKRNF